MLNQIKAVLQNKAGKIVESDVYGSTYMVWYGDNGLAVKVLKLFTNYEKLYIDSTGGAFTEGTKLPENNTAILYQNPYYKK